MIQAIAFWLAPEVPWACTSNTVSYQLRSLQAWAAKPVSELIFFYVKAAPAKLWSNLEFKKSSIRSNDQHRKKIRVWLFEKLVSEFMQQAEQLRHSLFIHFRIRKDNNSNCCSNIINIKVNSSNNNINQCDNFNSNTININNNNIDNNNINISNNSIENYIDNNNNNISSNKTPATPTATATTTSTLTSTTTATSSFPSQIEKFDLLIFWPVLQLFLKLPSRKSGLHYCIRWAFPILLTRDVIE